MCFLIFLEKFRDQFISSKLKENHWKITKIYTFQSVEERKYNYLDKTKK